MPGVSSRRGLAAWTVQESAFPPMFTP